MNLFFFTAKSILMITESTENMSSLTKSKEIFKHIRQRFNSGSRSLQSMMLVIDRQLIKIKKMTCGYKNKLMVMWRGANGCRHTKCLNERTSERI